MKFLFTTTIFLCGIIGSIIAQTPDNHPFSPPGAKWLYDLVSQVSRKHLVLEYSGDTLIQNKVCNKMQALINEYTFTGPNHDIEIKQTTQLGFLYYYSNGDTLFYVDRNTWQFQPMGNFSLNIGDSIFIQSNEFFSCPTLPSSGNYVKLLAEPTKIYDGRIFETQEYSSNKTWVYNVYAETGIIKNIGNFKSPFPVFHPDSCGLGGPESSIEAPVMGVLSCYYDNLRGYVHFFSTGISCEKYLYTFSNENYTGKLKLAAFPNPTSDFIEILGLGENEPYDLTVIDMQGRTYPVNRTGNRINIQPLKPGIYVFQVRYKNLSQHIKIIKI